MTLPPLPHELSTAIRPCHHRLNTLITSHLPLCLPPHTTNPHLYAAGIRLFLPLYTALEDVWSELLSRENVLDERIHSVLSELQTLHISRSSRLKQDVDNLCKSLDHRPETIRLWQQLEDAASQQYHSLHQILVTKPHLTLSWSWTMYLAIFNGGRYIRSCLTSTKSDFWHISDGPQLSFWEFDGDDDGESVKREFEKRFLVASQCLTRNERAEVVREAIRVFEVCDEIIGSLDALIESMTTAGSVPRSETQHRMNEPVPAVATSRRRKHTSVTRDTTVDDHEFGKSSNSTMHVSVLVALLALLAGFYHAILQVLCLRKTSLDGTPPLSPPLIVGVGKHGEAAISVPGHVD